MGGRARKGFEHRFDFPIAISAWEQVLGAAPPTLIESAHNNTYRPVDVRQNLGTTKHHNPSHEQIRKAG
jgi:hypothetical protein